MGQGLGQDIWVKLVVIIFYNEYSSLSLGDTSLV